MLYCTGAAVKPRKQGTPDDAQAGGPRTTQEIGKL
jgi:hypothetical protein